VSWWRFPLFSSAKVCQDNPTYAEIDNPTYAEIRITNVLFASALLFLLAGTLSPMFPPYVFGRNLRMFRRWTTSTSMTQPRSAPASASAVGTRGTAFQAVWCHERCHKHDAAMLRAQLQLIMRGSSEFWRPADCDEKSCQEGKEMERDGKRVCIRILHAARAYHGESSH